MKTRFYYPNFKHFLVVPSFGSFVVKKLNYGIYLYQDYYEDPYQVETTTGKWLVVIKGNGLFFRALKFTGIRGDVKIQLTRPPMCHSQSPPAATEMLEQLYLE